MTASITGRKRCVCGQYRTPLANGTMPRHVAGDWSRPCVPYNRRRKTCAGVGKFPPATVAWRTANSKTPAQIPLDQPKPRGGHRAAKRNAALKARYRRNAAGKYGAL